MKAMILAAGFGTRLSELTRDIPKALVPIHSKPLLHILLDRLTHAGFNEIAVNAHYKAEQILDFIKKYGTGSSIQIHLSYEEDILNTGGGIKKMLNYFSGNDPILVQNVDILCDVNYSKVFDYHKAKNSECTLVVNNRKAERPLQFDDNMCFKGRGVGPSPKDQHYGFCGIQVISPAIFENETASKFYSIEAYISALKSGKKIVGFDIKDAYWRDLGTLNDLHAAQKDITNNLFKIE